MGSPDRPVAVHTIFGACIYCKVEVLGTPDNPPALESPVFCGGCGGIMVIDTELLDDEWVPVFRRPHLLERDRLLKRPDVAAIRDAWNLDQLEARVASQSEKSKVKNVTGQRARVKSGQQVKLEWKGPDA
jgi:hypothetical protein